MACLGGTKEQPREWIRIRAGGILEHHAGRVCDRTHHLTNRAYCSPCPAYRGRRTDTTIATGLWPDGEPYALSTGELAQYEAAMDAALDDDFDLIAAWETRMAEGIGDRTLREIGDPGALERRASYMRAYRRGRNDPTNAARQARFRARHRNVTTLRGGSDGQSLAPARTARARAREEGSYVTEASR